MSLGLDSKISACLAMRPLIEPTNSVTIRGDLGHPLPEIYEGSCRGLIDRIFLLPTKARVHFQRIEQCSNQHTSDETFLII